MVDITIKRGSRAFICGVSGSGKTTLALRLCEAMPSPLVILDTKYDPSLGKWAKSNKIKIVSKKMPDWKTIKSDVVVRPPPDWLAAPEDLDWWLGQAFFCKYVPSIYIDEGYQVGATANKMGSGVTGLWTRGRAFGFRTLIGAQRPAWISKFVITESDVLFVGRLNNVDDRKTIFNATGEKAALNTQERHHFLYIKQDGLETVPLKPFDNNAPSIYDMKNRDVTRSKVERLK